MNIRILGLLAALTLSSPAFALDGIPGSGFLHNTAGGKTDINFALAYTTLNIKNEEGQFFKGFKGTGMSYGLLVEHGFTNNLSAGVHLLYYKLSTTPDPENNGFFGKFEDKGMKDPQLYVNYRMDMGPGSLRFGGMLNISTGTHNMGSDLGETANTGGNSIAPWVGYEALMGDHTFGGKLTYQMFIGDRKFHRDATLFYAAYDSTGKGAEQTWLDAFYEFSPRGDILIGLNLDYHNTQTTKETVNGTETNINNGNAGLGGMLYGAWARALNDSQFIVINPFINVDNGGGPSMNGSGKSSSLMLAGVAVDYLF